MKSIFFNAIDKKFIEIALKKNNIKHLTNAFYT